MGKRKTVLILIWIPIILIGLLNIVTVFSPEIGFDSLWYHLTLPKLWLLKRQWYFKGGLLYYSVMPRITETLFIPLIKYFDFIGPKAFLFLSGVGTCIIIWKITDRLKFSTILKSVSVSLFYCTWLVSWQSGSSYIDLFRTFLESVALLYLVSGKMIKGGIFIGLSIGTKWLSLGSLAIYALVFGPILIIPAAIISSPWFFIAQKFTGNPLYPIFDTIIHNAFSSFQEIFTRLILLPLSLTFPFDDFLSPMIFVLVIMAVFSLYSRQKDVRKISQIGLLGAIFSQVLDPPSSRYFLPYLPAIIIAAVAFVSKMKDKYASVFVSLCILSSLMIFGLRFVAVKKYFPYILGKQNTNTFLTTQASRLPDTFIDSDEFVKNNIPEESRILIDKLHNLYYFPHNFDHTSWANPEQDYDFLITTNTDQSEVNGTLVHTNIVGIQIFKLNNK
jgi:hypothetical protein